METQHQAGMASYTDPVSSLDKLGTMVNPVLTVGKTGLLTLGSGTLVLLGT